MEIMLVIKAPASRSQRRENVNHPDSLQGRREPGFRALKIRSFVAENAPQDDGSCRPE
ncbi:hypothetical protein [Aminivibrio sp.]|uniref:hypothetical protein n=1 Tax=Aminivibrio sp. TaxID=1872489 RepID=UPI003D95C80A